MSLKKEFDEAVKKLGKDMVAEILKQQKEIDELAANIAKQQLDLGRQSIVTNPLSGVKSFPFHTPVTDTIYKVPGGIYKITLPPGFLINSDGTISSSGFSEYDDWKKVADEIADAAPCRHEWVNVGFHFDKWVCKKCDVNKGSNE